MNQHFEHFFLEPSRAASSSAVCAKSCSAKVSFGSPLRHDTTQLISIRMCASSIRVIARRKGLNKTIRPKKNSDVSLTLSFCWKAERSEFSFFWDITSLDAERPNNLDVTMPCLAPYAGSKPSFSTWSFFFPGDDTKNGDTVTLVFANRLLETLCQCDVKILIQSLSKKTPSYL